MSKKQKRKVIDHQISLDITENVEHALYMTMGIGTGETADDRHIDIAMNIDGRALIITIGEQQFIVNTNTLVETIVNQVATKKETVTK